MNALRYLLIVSVLAAPALAGGEFSTGGAELLQFKGYLISDFQIYGEEDADPDMGFDIIAALEWKPRLNEWLDAKIAFKSKPTAFEGDMEDLSLTTEDILLNLHFTENVTFSMGQFKRPFGYNYTRSGSSMYFLDRAILQGMSEFKNFGKRDIGANLNLGFDMVNLDVAFTNGAGDNEPEDDSNRQFTLRAEIEPVDGITVAGALGSHSEDDSTETYSATGLDFYTVVDYPLSETSTLNFVGEYLIMGEPSADNVDMNDATAYAFTLAPEFELDGPALLALRPAIRYETYSPSYEGGTDPRDDMTAIDFSLNLDLYSSKNTLQVGGRNLSFEDENTDGYTDMYIAWRMKF
ncbi:MAG: porin [Candidatus Aegiribacteria sp.]